MSFETLSSCPTPLSQLCYTILTISFTHVTQLIIASLTLQNSPTFKDVKVRYTPIVLGGLHKSCNITAPIFIKNKSTWINKERERWAEVFNIPLRESTPPGFPISTVSAMRALVALQVDGSADDETVAKCIEVLWCVVWHPKAECLRGVGGQGENGEWDLKDPKVLEVLLGSVVGEEIAKRVVGRIGSQEVKDKLTGNTKIAFEKGAFGLPWFECVNEKGEEEGYWGFDHLGQVVRFLGLNAEGEAQRSGESLRALL